MQTKLLVFMFVFFCSLNVNALIISHCFNNRSIKVECVPQRGDKFSLEGEFVIKSQGKEIKYGFGSRRAWGPDWCSVALKQIKHVMSAPRFCIEVEMSAMADGIDDIEFRDLLMIEGVFSSKGQWTYFDEYKRQGVQPL